MCHRQKNMSVAYKALLTPLENLPALLSKVGGGREEEEEVGRGQVKGGSNDR